MRFSSSYFHNTICEWNLLDKSVQDSPSLAVFKSKLLRFIRPGKNPVYNIYDILGIKLLTRLRVNFSPLNEHRFRHDFDCLSPICICGTGKEDNEHYLLHSPQFTAQRQDILGQVSHVGYDVASMIFVICYYMGTQMKAPLQTESSYKQLFLLLKLLDVSIN